MKNIFEAIHEAQDGTENNMVFFLSSKISRENISHFKGLSSDIDDTAVYFSTGGYGFDLEFGKEFDILFLMSKPEEYLKVNSIFISASINPQHKMDFLPAGLTGLGLIRFPEGVPESVNFLSEFGSTEKSGKDEMIYLTTQSVMDKILENLK